MPVDPPRQLQPVHGAGKVDIAEDDIDRLTGGERHDRLRCVRRLDDRIAGEAQILGRGDAQQSFVFDNQNHRPASRPVRHGLVGASCHDEETGITYADFR